ncbi:MAG: hypothetical protein GXY32_03720 [Ruminococcaceae bacterium]|nr:hypothetical protein [Oscillospiraceae bacterium]
MKTTFQNFLFEKRDGVAIFTMNRPDVLNAMNQASKDELYEVMVMADADDEIKVIIFTGAGEKAFVAGADINMLRAYKGTDMLRPITRTALERIENSQKPVIAAVNGFAFGAGCELALACDIRLASPNARFGLPETNLGILPGGGGTVRLARMVGVGVAKDMILGGRTLKAEEAQRLGLVMQVVEQPELLNTALALAKALMKKGPLGLALAKQLINKAYDSNLDAALDAEGWAFSVLLDTEDKQEGTNAFLEKRDPFYKGR